MSLLAFECRSDVHIAFGECLELGTFFSMIYTSHFKAQPRPNDFERLFVEFHVVFVS